MWQRKSKSPPIFTFIMLWAFGQTVHLVHAEPLDPQSCLNAVSEQQVLSNKGVTEYLSKGYSNTSGNISTESIQNIIRWFELEEQIKFRCPRSKSSKLDKVSSKASEKEKKELQTVPAAPKPDLKNQTTKGKKNT